MRYGVLADIHANLHALEAVTAELGRLGVDRYLCAGDIVGYGAQPNECVERVAALDPICVVGNHDLMALGRLSDANCVRLARRAMRWTRGVLSEDARGYLASLPTRAEASGGVVVAHGSLDDPEEYVLWPDQAADQLERLGRVEPGARALILGHTHLPFASSGGGEEPGRPRGVLGLGGARAWLLNPGAVGQSRDSQALARFMVLDLARGEADFLAIPYDIRGARELLRRSGLPGGSYHLRPSRARAALGRIPRLVRGGGRSVRLRN